MNLGRCAGICLLVDVSFLALEITSHMYMWFVPMYIRIVNKWYNVIDGTCLDNSHMYLFSFGSPLANVSGQGGNKK